MKAKYLSMAALALMGALASCQSDDDFTVARPADAVSVNFSVGSLQVITRSNALATDEAQSQFNSGDQVCLSTAEQEPVTYQYDGTNWNEATPGKFLLWKADQMNFQAYYPTTAGTSLTAFTMPTDQSTVEKINAADYMTGSQTVNKGDEVQMTLNRKMARVIVRIAGFTDQYRDDQKTVSNVRIYSEASDIEDGNPTGSSTEIQPYAQGDGGQGSTYTALVVPGSGDSGADFITLTDGENKNLTVKGIPELNAGNSYTFNLVVGKNRIEVASVTVQDWTTGETLAEGQAEEELAVPVTAITLNKTETTIYKVNGTATETLSVTAVTPDEATDKTYTWSSDATGIATVDENGVVTAVAAGTAHIRATANDGSGVYGECTVTVSDLSAYYSKMVECGCDDLDGKCYNGANAENGFTGQVLSAAQAIALAQAKAAETSSNCAVFYDNGGSHFADIAFAKNDGTTGSAQFYYTASDKGLSGYKGYYVSK